MDNTKPSAWLHSGSIGDTIAAIPAMNEFYRKTKRKIILYFTNNQKAEYYPGATHGTRNEGNDMVMLNEKVIEMLIPLFKSQECIEDCKIYSNQHIDIDLNKIRETFVNMPLGCISRWYFYVFPDLACDLSKQWLFIPDEAEDLARGKIIITRTERYLNPLIEYSFMKKYEQDCLFVGTDIEYAIFITRYKLDIKRLIIKDFLQLAQAIKQCKFHLSNQTMCFQLSSGLKHPRIVELCSYAPNVIPIGENAFDFYGQQALEYYVGYLLGGTAMATNFDRLPLLSEMPVLNTPNLGVKEGG